MNLIWYIFFFFIAMILLLIFSQVRIHILINKQKKNDYIQLDFYLFYNLIKFKKKIPVILFESFSEGIKFKSESDILGTSDDNTKKDRITPDKYKLWRKQFNRLIRNVDNLHQIIKGFLRHVYLDLYKWESVVGTGDAMHTGLVAGFIWTGKGIILALTSNYVVFTKKPDISVKPVFNKKVYNSKFECILRFRVGYVILTGISLLLRLRRGGEKNGRRTSYSGINANSYGKS